MKNKKMIFTTVLAAVTFLFAACGNESSDSSAGSASGTSTPSLGVSGQLLDANKSPVAGATITAITASYQLENAKVFAAATTSTTTDDNGFYSLVVTGTGEHKFSVKDSGGASLGDIAITISTDKAVESITPTDTTKLNASQPKPSVKETSTATTLSNTTKDMKGKYNATKIEAVTAGGTLSMPPGSLIVDANNKIIWGDIYGSVFSKDAQMIVIPIGSINMTLACTVSGTAGSYSVSCTGSNIYIPSENGNTLATAVNLELTQTDNTTSSVAAGTLNTMGTFAADGTIGGGEYGTGTTVDGTDDPASDKASGAPVGTDLVKLVLGYDNSANKLFGYFTSGDGNLNAEAVSYRLTFTNSHYSEVMLDFYSPSGETNWYMQYRINDGSHSTPAGTQDTDFGFNTPAGSTLEFFIDIDTCIGDITTANIDTDNKLAGMQVKLESRANSGDTVYDTIFPQALVTFD